MPRNVGTDLTSAESAMVEAMHLHTRWDTGYAHQQSTRPQTVGYGFADSPGAQAMWIYEKFWRWTDCGGDPTNALSLDEMLDVISLYWLTNTGASSARLYWESYKKGFFAVPLELPVGCSIFAKELYRAPRTWAQACMKQLIY